MRCNRSKKYWTTWQLTFIDIRFVHNQNSRVTDITFGTLNTQNHTPNNKFKSGANFASLADKMSCIFKIKAAICLLRADLRRGKRIHFHLRLQFAAFCLIGLIPAVRVSLVKCLWHIPWDEICTSIDALHSPRRSLVLSPALLSIYV